MLRSWLTGLLIATVGVPAVAQAQRTIGAFRIDQYTDDMDDTVSHYITSTGARDGMRTPEIHWSCWTNLDGVPVLNFRYSFGKYMSGDVNGNITVRYRFDALQASESENWSLLIHKDGGPLG